MPIADPTPSDYHLTYLRERWERDRSSRVFLQLAEEYRRRGLHADAIEVLETGLAHHPGYLAAQVSLGRCRLEAGDARGAVAGFERVLQQDPTQAVASRLLVEAWLQLGEEEPARAALDRCRLIGIQPADLAGFGERLSQLHERSQRRAEPEPIPAIADAPVAAREVAEAPSPPASFEVAFAAEPAPVASASAEEPAAPIVAAEPIEAVAPAVSAPAAAADSGAAGAGDTAAAAAAVATGTIFRLPRQPGAAIVLPMRPRGEPRPARMAGGTAAIFHLPGPRGGVGAIFRLPTQAATIAPETVAPAPPPAVATAAPPPVARPAAVAPVFAPPVEPRVEAPAAMAPEPAAEPDAASTADTWWRGPSAAPAPAPAASPRPAPAPAPLPAPELVPAPEPAPEPAPVAPAALAPAVAAPVPTMPPSPVATPMAPAAAAGVQVQRAGTVAPAELRPSEPGTATLGELYLRQGYVREAEQIFRQVLERDPENEAALRGLESIGRQRAAQLTAADLVTGGETAAAGLTARKMHLLKRYLRTIRRGAGADVSRTPE